ncbi:hypothetical protein KJ836_00615 [Patescibacteria group bacterium]|nr:hypothetical protein [Patescibacteria group bacterium]
MYNTDMKKKWVVPFVITGGGLAILASAFCPVCAVAAVAGLGISRWLGVDDSVTGVWIGVILLMASVLTIKWLKRRFENFQDWWQGVVFFVCYLAVLTPLWWLGQLGHPLNRLWGMDKLVLGIASGTIVVILAINLHYWLKTKNNGKSYFLMQRTVLNLSSLILVSLFFYFFSK